MDISAITDAIDDVESADFVIVDPTNGKPVLVLTLAGPVHPARRALAKTADPGDVWSPRFEVQVLTAATLGWKSADGTPADQPFDANVMAGIYRAHKWLRRQVSAKLQGGHKNFITKTEPKRSGVAKEMADG